MDKKKKFILAIIVEIIVINFLGVRVKKKEKKHVTEVNISYIYKQGIYAKYIKRLLDIVYALLAILCFGWLYIVIALLVRIKLGKPIVFTQYRPGKIDSITGKEQIFKIYKFRSMTDERDKKGELLPDESRLTSFGKALRSSSLDELPEVINILKGDMSIVGPRPQLVKDMVFMTDEERRGIWFALDFQV